MSRAAYFREYRRRRKLGLPRPEPPIRAAATPRFEYDLERRYGLPQGSYDRMLADQGGVCVICRRPETRSRRGAIQRLHVDHDHRTGRVRGLVCRGCNSLIELVEGLGPEIVDRVRSHIED